MPQEKITSILIINNIIQNRPNEIMENRIKQQIIDKHNNVKVPDCLSFNHDVFASEIDLRQQQSETIKNFDSSTQPV